MKVIKGILNFFKSIFTKQEVIDDNKLEKLLEEVQAGDIIWGNRQLIEKTDRIISDGHKEGPFIVVDKCEKGLVCLYGTGVEHDKYFELNPLDYNIFKKTYFKLFNLCIVDEQSFIKVMDTLKENDKKKILKQLKIQRKNYYKIDNKIFNIKIPLDIGDIIHNNLNYLIIDIVDNKFLCIKVDKSNTDLRFNLKIDYFRNLDYSNLVLIEKTENIKYINSVCDNILIYILKKQKEYIENKDIEKETQRGSVIHKDCKLFYIYGEEGKNFLVFEIYKNKQEDSNVITINNKKYYTNYNESIIDKKSKFVTVFMANETEINVIKENKKSYAKTKKKNEIKNKKIDKQDNLIIINEQEYIVVEKLGNIIGCLNVHDKNNKRKHLIYFNLEEINQKRL